MNGLPAELPAAGVVRVAGPDGAGAGFLVSDDGLIVTCAHVLVGSAPGAIVRIEPHADRRPLEAAVVLLRDPPDVAVMQLTAPVPPGAAVLALGRSPRGPRAGLRTFGYPAVRPEAGLPGELAVQGVTADAGYEQLALRSEEATLGFSGAPIWDPELGVVVGMVKSIARADPGQRLASTAIGVPAEVIRDLCPELRLPAGCPYRGLEPFTEEHADYYYGRERATSQLLASLAARDFVAVVAVSGGGKSSLLQAGLARGMRDRPVAGLAQRVRCYLRISSQPYAELLDCLGQRGMPLSRELAAASPPEVAAAVLGAAPPAGLIVVADQFERLYTDCEDAERKRFVELLLCLATDTVKVVIGLRADFYHLALADVGERLAAGQVALAPMSGQDLSQAIAAPAAKLLRSFQPGLAQQLAADVRGRPGDLPLLQFALTELWERDGTGGVLTEEAYRGLGVELSDGTHLPGAQGALIGRAEQLWQSLGPGDRPRLQRILLGLIAVRPTGTSAAPQAGSLRDLSRPALLAQWDADDQRLIQQLIDARLLTADRATAGGQATVEVSHEVLLRAWPRLQSWLVERGKFVQWRAQDLAPNLERWLSSRKPGSKGNPEFLLPRPLLDPALQWLDDYPDELAGPPAAYIRASQRRRTLRRDLIGGAVAVLVIASLAAAGIFFSLQQTAVQQQTIAVSRLLISESQAQIDPDPVMSKLLSIAAWRLYPSSAARDAMLTATANPEIRVLTIPGGGITYAVAFSPDGNTLATSTDNGAVRLWDLATGRQIGRTLTVPGGGLTNAVAFSPDGKTLATGGIVGSSDGMAQLWDMATRRQIGSTLSLTVPGGIVDSVAFSRDGKTLATGGSDGTARLWDMTTGRQIGSTLTIPGGQVRSVALSPDGKTLATGSTDGTARLWHVATGRQIVIPLTVPGGINSVALSPDGTTLATGSDDGTARLWDMTTELQIGSTPTIPGGINSVALSPDGKTLATGSTDGTARLWHVATGRQIGSTDNSSSVDSVAFSPDGKTVATGDVTLTTGGSYGTARLWDLATGQQIGSNLTTPGGISTVALSPDGKTLATGSLNGTARLWDLATGQQIGSTLTTPGGISTVALSPDGKTLATSTDNGTAQLWDLATGQQIGSILTIPGGISSVAFSPDGKTLATGSDDGTAQLWDVGTGRQIGHTLTIPGGRVYSVAFSRDGKTLATGCGDGTARLWDLATGQQIGNTFTIPGDFLTYSVAFSRDGKTLATGSSDGTARLWDVAYLTDTVSDLCASAGRSLTRAEWARYTPGLAYRNICP